MKKILVFSSIVILIFVGLFFIQKQQTGGNDLYKDQVSLNQLTKEIKKNESQFVYFYQEDCVHCKKVSPIVIPMAKDLNIDLRIIDLKKHPDGWDRFKIKGTPTLVYFNSEKEVDRLVGEQEKETFKNWFEEKN